MNRIKISDVNELATEVIFKDIFVERRDVIVKWLKDKGIPVWGKRRTE